MPCEWSQAHGAGACRVLGAGSGAVVEGCYIMLGWCDIVSMGVFLGQQLNGPSGNLRWTFSTRTTPALSDSAHTTSWHVALTFTPAQPAAGPSQVGGVT